MLLQNWLFNNTKLKFTKICLGNSCKSLFLINSSSVYGAKSPETLLLAKTYWAKMTIFWLEYVSVKTNTQLKVEKLDPISEVVVQESFDRSTKYLITNMQIPRREQTFVKYMMRLLPYPVGKIRQLKHLFPLEEFQLPLLAPTST